MTLIRLVGAEPLTAPVVVAALDGWVDAGSGATLAAGLLADETKEGHMPMRIRRRTAWVVSGPGPPGRAG